MGKKTAPPPAPAPAAPEPPTSAVTSRANLVAEPQSEETATQDEGSAPSSGASASSSSSSSSNKNGDPPDPGPKKTEQVAGTAGVVPPTPATSSSGPGTKPAKLLSPSPIAGGGAGGQLQRQGSSSASPDKRGGSGVLAVGGEITDGHSYARRRHVLLKIEGPAASCSCRRFSDALLNFRFVSHLQYSQEQVAWKYLTRQPLVGLDAGGPLGTETRSNFIA